MDNNIKPDFVKACNAANEILVSSELIKGFPFSIDKVILDETDITIMEYSVLEKGELSPEKIVGSKDGALIERNGRQILFINEKMPENRRNFTKGHEFGHYYLGHDLELIQRYTDTHDPRFEPLYSKYEVEANMFSAQLFMPEQLIIELSKRHCKISEEFIISIFGVSKEAAKKRLTNIRKIYNWYNPKENYSTIKYDDIILKKFSSLIYSIAPKSYDYDLEQEIEKERERQSWY